ncbi:MAG: FAD-dependent oxidoreductase [Ignavibacteria bacterium]|nr:FAD-dependent oxidoreductase [Ignavibacteria bacterium]MBK6417630.1 FAD-dependent oxidoreductase [Ignavibacteria bacterium]MBK7411135.1 FAD-dependent oxidoreductase [Ignavibacteria bacterium]
MTHSTDFLVLGAGYAGLTAAALLAHEGRAVTVLEGHETLGGCASFFRTGGYTFDVGATTFSGVLPSQPAGRVFAHLGLQPELVKQDPGMLIRMKDRDVVRHAAPEKWIDEIAKHFPHGDQRGYWERQYALERKVWSMVNDQPSLPPTTARDWAEMVNVRSIKQLPMVPGLFRSASSLMRKYRVDSDSTFVDFINEQLLISTQNTSDKAPYLTAAMGLTYPSETYYPMGGMYRPALMLMRHATAHGAQMKFRRMVTSIDQLPSGRWSVRCANGETYEASTVISSVPIWNMSSLTTGKTQRYFESLSTRNADSWCAFSMYFALEGVPKLSSQYVQLHLDRPISGVHASSIFLTFSHPDDREKAPAGHTTVTVSTHTRSEDWTGLSPTQHDEKRATVMTAILDVIQRRMPECAGLTPIMVSGGTPHTWERYTSRFKGFVGGLPHSINRPMIFMPPNRTPFHGLYMIGDSVFPGQGTPAVMLGAWNTVNRIFAA